MWFTLLHTTSKAVVQTQLPRPPPRCSVYSITTRYEHLPGCSTVLPCGWQRGVRRCSLYGKTRLYNRPSCAPPSMEFPQLLVELYVRMALNQLKRMSVAKVGALWFFRGSGPEDTMIGIDRFKAEYILDTFLFSVWKVCIETLCHSAFWGKYPNQVSGNNMSGLKREFMCSQTNLLNIFRKSF